MEQRYQAVSFVIHDGESVVEVARRFNVSRQTVHAWLARYERGGLAALADRSHRPKGCAHQMPAAVEAVVLEMRRINPDWGPRRLLHELGREGIDPLPSRSGIYRLLKRHGPDRPERPASPGPQVQAVGAGHGDGAVADGRGRRDLAGRRHGAEGPDRDRRPFPVHRLRGPDGPGELPFRVFAFR